MCWGEEIYVDADGSSPVKDGTTWYRSFTHVQDALSVSQAGDEIRVAGGVYFPDRSSVNPTGSKSQDATFAMKSGVSIRGGYAGFGASDPNYRDFEIHESVLSGDFDGNDAVVRNANDLFSTGASRSENSFNIVVANGVDSKGVLDGFVITGGNAKLSSTFSGGGGIHISGGSPKISNCIINANFAEGGGGISIDESNPRVINCYILGNWAYDCGGGINSSSSNPLIRNCVLSGNNAEDYGGGGLWNSGQTATLINCTFNGNWASDGGSGIFAKGGVARLFNCIVQEQISETGGVVEAYYSNLPSYSGGGSANINVAPGFVDAVGVDGIAGTIDDNLRLATGSACIDSGDPMMGHDPNDRDLDGKARVSNGVVDMGAFEFVHLPSLIGHWKLDESSGIKAFDSGGDNDGSTVGDPVWYPEEGRIDGSLEFDGVDDYVNCGADSEFNIRSAITVSAWIKVGDVSGGWRGIVTKGDSSWRLQFAGDDDPSGVLEFACSGVEVPYAADDWGNIIGNKPVNDGKWHHAVGVYDGLTMELYVDGELDSFSEASGLINTNTFDVLIGENAERTGRFWEGMIDDVRVYDYALNGDEIFDLSDPATTYHVDIIGGDNLNDGLSRSSALKDIKEGIVSAEDGDTVVVWPGVYDEAVHYKGKAITIRSGAEAAVIRSPEVDGYAFSFFMGEGPDSVLSNFVICDSPGAIYCNSSSPTLKNLTIVNNGFGIEAYEGANPEISNCIFWNNTHGNTESCESVFSWDWEPEEPVAHWRFEEGEGTVAQDLVGSNDGNINFAQWTEGESGGGLWFDGDEDHVWVPNSSSLSVGAGGNNFTLSAWVKPDRIDGIFVIVSKIEGHDNKEYMLSIDKGRIRLDIEKDNNNGREYSEAVVRVGLWQHVAVTFDKSNLAARFFYNGEAIGNSFSDKPITMLPYDLGSNLYIGMRGALDAVPPYIDGEFRGSIDELMIFDKILSDNQMKVVYKSTLNPQFADPSTNDYHLMSERGRYVPLDAAATGGIEGLWTFDDVTSPCVDGGDPTERPQRELMPNGGRVNMGAYGNTGFASMSEWTVKGDINRDGVVDVRDLAIMAGDWLSRLSWTINDQ